MNPLVSVILPCYNAEKFIEEAIDSVLNQSYKNFELIIIDDGSSDGSKDIIQSFKDERITYIYQDNRGVSAARNNGIHSSNGSLIAFIDADDIYFQENLEAKVGFLGENPGYALVHSYEQVFSKTLDNKLFVAKGRGGDTFLSLIEFEKKVIHSPTSVVCRKRVLLDLDGFDENVSTSADWDMWIRIARTSHFGIIRKPLTGYRRHYLQMHSNVDLMRDDLRNLLKKYKESNFFASVKHYRNCYSKYCFTIGMSYLRDAHQFFKGMKYLVISAYVSPTFFSSYLVKKFKTR